MIVVTCGSKVVCGWESTSERVSANITDYDWWLKTDGGDNQS